MRGLNIRMKTANAVVQASILGLGNERSDDIYLILGDAMHLGSYDFGKLFFLISRRKTMDTLISLPTDPHSIPGVESVINDDGRLVVRFKNGTKVTVKRSPLSRFIQREAFDVYVPGSGDICQVALSKSPDEVIAMLGHMAADAAKNCDRPKIGQLLRW